MIDWLWGNTYIIYLRDFERSFQWYKILVSDITDSFVFFSIKPFLTCNAFYFTFQMYNVEYDEQRH